MREIKNKSTHSPCCHFRTALRTLCDFYLSRYDKKNQLFLLLSSEWESERGCTHSGESWEREINTHYCIGKHLRDDDAGNDKQPMGKIQRKNKYNKQRSIWVSSEEQMAVYKPNMLGCVVLVYFMALCIYRPYRSEMNNIIRQRRAVCVRVIYAKMPNAERTERKMIQIVTMS